MNGFSHDKSFIRANRKTYRQFKRRIRLTTPQFTITADGGGRNESDDASETGTVVANFSDEEQKVGNSGTVPRDLDYVEEVINKYVMYFTIPTSSVSANSYVGPFPGSFPTTSRSTQSADSSVNTPTSGINPHSTATRK